MSGWRVQDGNDIKEYTEETLRKKLRSRDLSGAELARREGETAWKPLHEFDVFREEVPFTGASAAAARGRLVGSLAMHVVVFGAIGIAFGFPFWMAFWGIGLAGHAFTTVRGLSRLRGTVAAGPAPASKGAEVAAKAGDPLQAELETAFAQLEVAAKGRSDIDVAGTRKAAFALLARRASILPICDPALRSRLEAEQDALIAQEEKAAPELKEMLRQQALALQQRLDAIDEAAGIAARLEARLRTVLHQTENLRVQLARAAAESDVVTPMPSLAEDVRRIQREIAADAEAEAATRPRPRGQTT